MNYVSVESSVWAEISCIFYDIFFLISVLNPIKVIKIKVKPPGKVKS